MLLFCMLQAVCLPTYSYDTKQNLSPNYLLYFNHRRLTDL